MKLVGSKQMRDLDRETIEVHGVAGELLMERAGRGVARAVRRVAGLVGSDTRSVLLCAGGGNNGGDAFVAARYLAAAGCCPEVWLTCDGTRLTGAALSHYRKMAACGIPVRVLDSEEAWVEAGADAPDADVVVDALLGTGLEGAARGVAGAAIRFVNMVGARVPVVSVDVPSGMDADTGAADGPVVAADVTVAMGFPKRGFVTASGMSHTGSVEVVDIGIPRELSDAVSSDPELITAADVREVLGRRERAAHKGDFGHVLIVGGARGYSGAVTMAAAAAIRSGAGLVSAIVPSGIVTEVAGGVHEAMVHGASETGAGSLCRDIWRGHSKLLSEFDAVLVGPGMTAGAESRAIVEQLLADCRVPLVLDADALNVMKRSDGLLCKARAGVVLTPHPGELARFLGVNVDEVQAGRLKACFETARETGTTVVLKGAGTVVSDGSSPVWVNSTGNPGMATAGMGDVLGGSVVALLAQGIRLLDAAKAGVYLHGLAGDRAAMRTSQAGLSAGCVIGELPFAFREILGR